MDKVRVNTVGKGSDAALIGVCRQMSQWDSRANCCSIDQTDCAVV